jgi:hypothetical protein
MKYLITRNEKNKNNISLGLDLSAIMLDAVQKVIKVGDADSLAHDYKMSCILSSSIGFMRYDDFRNGVILMPYFPLGSIAKYTWNPDNVVLLRSCLKQVMLSVISIFCNHGIIHGNFHTGNILLRPTKQSVIKYDISGVGQFEVPTYGIRTLIMDFEHSRVVETSTKDDNIIAFIDFYYDSKQFILSLLGVVNDLDPIQLSNVRTIIKRKLMENDIITFARIEGLLAAIDHIAFLQPSIVDR